MGRWYDPRMNDSNVYQGPAMLEHDGRFVDAVVTLRNGVERIAIGDEVVEGFEQWAGVAELRSVNPRHDALGLVNAPGVVPVWILGHRVGEAIALRPLGDGTIVELEGSGPLSISR